MQAEFKTYGRVQRSAMLLYGVVSYLVFFASFLWAIGFLGGFGVPVTLDGVAERTTLQALLINLGLLTLFSVQHSVMARPAFKRWWTRFVPQPVERSTYVLFSSLALILLFLLWQPLGGVIWQFEGTAGQVAMYTGFAAGWVLLFMATCAINHFDLFGLRQVWYAFRGQPVPPIEFKTPWMYRVVRHPLYLGWLFAIWCTPTMTVAHLFFAVVTTAYIFAGIHFEEKDLTNEHEDYADYQASVPMILPGKRSTFATWRGSRAERGTV